MSIKTTVVYCSKDKVRLSQTNVDISKFDNQPAFTYILCEYAHTGTTFSAEQLL